MLVRSCEDAKAAKVDSSGTHMCSVERTCKVDLCQHHLAFPVRHLKPEVLEPVRVLLLHILKTSFCC